MYSMLFGNNSGGGANALLDGASFYLELTHTAVPQRGSITPSFTRATTKTWQNNDGYMVTGVAGEIGFPGARRVRNYISASSEDFSNAAWTKLNTTVVVNQATAPNGTLTADLVHPASSGADRVVYQNGLVSTVVGDKMILEIYAKYAGIQWLWFGTLGGGTGPASVVASFDIQNGVVGQAGSYFSSSAIEDIGDGWYRCSAIATISAAPLYPIYGLADADGSTTVTASGSNGIYLWGAQLEDVTAQTTQTAGEYVSVGVESAPYYHGSMVDGVKCYDTDRSGNPISTTGSYPLVGYVPWEARTNLCLQSNAFTTTWVAIGSPAATQNATGPDGATRAWTFTDDSAASNEGVQQNITPTAANYTFSVFVKKTTGAQSSYPIIDVTRAGTHIAAATIDTSNGVATVWTAYTGLTLITSSALCESYNADFWRVSLTYLGTAVAHTHNLLAAATTNATQSTGTVDAAAQGSAVFYGAQVELGSFATPYIPTTTVAVARNASLLTYTGADVANIKTLACTFSRGVGVSSSGVMLSLDDGGATNWSLAYLSTPTNVQFAGNSGAGSQWVINSNTYTPGSDSKIAWSQAANDIKADKDGTALTPDTSATPATTDRLSVGHYASGQLVLNGPVNHIYGWTRNLSQSELGAIDRA